MPKDNDIEDTKDEMENEQIPSQDELDRTIKSLDSKQFLKVINGIFEDKTLSDVEKMIVAEDIHRIAGKTMTYETIGKILGISKVGAKKVEERALKKAEKIIRKAGIQKTDDVF